MTIKLNLQFLSSSEFVRVLILTLNDPNRLCWGHKDSSCTVIGFVTKDVFSFCAFFTSVVQQSFLQVVQITENVKVILCKFPLPEPWPVTGSSSLWYIIKCAEPRWPSSGRAAAAAAKSLQSCPTLCNPIDGRAQTGSSVNCVREWLKGCHRLRLFHVCPR